MLSKTTTKNLRGQVIDKTIISKCCKVFNDFLEICNKRESVWKLNCVAGAKTIWISETSKLFIIIVFLQTLI